MNNRAVLYQVSGKSGKLGRIVLVWQIVEKYLRSAEIELIKFGKFHQLDMIGVVDPELLGLLG